MKVLGLKYFIILNGLTAYEWQIGPLYGRFTKLRYWWQVETWHEPPRKAIFWHDAMFVGWDPYWRKLWDEPETPQ